MSLWLGHTQPEGSGLGGTRPTMGSPQIVSLYLALTPASHHLGGLVSGVLMDTSWIWGRNPGGLEGLDS